MNFILLAETPNNDVFKELGVMPGVVYVLVLIVLALVTVAVIAFGFVIFGKLFDWLTSFLTNNDLPKPPSTDQKDNL